MAESTLSKTLMRHLKNVGHATRIENLATVGMPDVSYCINGFEGHIENKWLLSWHKRDPDRIVGVRHFTAQQRKWATDRVRAGGRTFVLLQVQLPSNDYLLFDGAWAAKHLGMVPQSVLMANALVRGQGHFPWPGILSVLQDGAVPRV